MKELEEQKESEEHKAEEKAKKLTRIKAKVMTVARFNRMNKKLQNNSDELKKMKVKNPDGKLPMGLLTKTQDEISDDINMFLALKKIDSDNEKFPIVTFQRRESEKL